ncbi:MAG: hypothetical protein HC887_10215 [Desulfobacteraceae bacterium]|nr:hypothetical protein [Desulfobacteraceae bacterium]
MRWKAEQAIRRAAAELGNPSSYRLDKVRAGAGLHRKVFDKTILDMARVGTIELFGNDISGMSGAEIANLVQHGTTIYVSFAFLDVREPEPVETVSVQIDNIEQVQWDKFRYLCKTRENKEAVQKLKEMIYEYVRKT